MCGAPTEVERSYPMGGVDFDGQAREWAYSVIRCAAGHWYTQNMSDLDRGETDADRPA